MRSCLTRVVVLMMQLIEFKKAHKSLATRRGLNTLRGMNMLRIHGFLVNFMLGGGL